MKGPLVIYADGAISPRAAGAGALATDGNGRVLALACRHLPPMTNNEAEYHGLILALETAAALRASVVEIRLDSEVVVNQMQGDFAVNSPRLKPLHRRACEQARAALRVTYIRIPRGENRLADALAAEGLAGRVWSLEGR